MNADPCGSGSKALIGAVNKTNSVTCIGHSSLDNTARLAHSVHADDEVGEVVETVEHAEHVHTSLHRQLAELKAGIG